MESYTGDIVAFHTLSLAGKLLIRFGKIVIIRFY